MTDHLAEAKRSLHQSTLALKRVEDIDTDLGRWGLMLQQDAIAHALIALGERRTRCFKHTLAGRFRG